MKTPNHTTKLFLAFILTIGLAASLLAADISKMVQTAMKYFEKGQYNKSLKLFMKIRKIDPNNAAAREYMMLCSQKIVEKKLGTQSSDQVKQEISMDKQIHPEIPAAAPTESDTAGWDQLPNVVSQADTVPTPPAIAPAAPPPPAAAPVAPIPETPVVPEPVTAKQSPDFAVLEELFQVKPAEVPAVTPPSDAAPAATAGDFLPETLPPVAEAEPAIPNFVPIIPQLPESTAALPSAPQISTAPVTPMEMEAAISLESPAGQTLTQQRSVLTKELERRRLGSENIVELNERRGQIEISLFLNRLFLPYSDILRDESFVILDHISSQLHKKTKQRVMLKAVDSAAQTLPADLQNLSLRRCTVIFSYLLQQTLTKKQ